MATKHRPPGRPWWLRILYGTGLAIALFLLGTALLVASLRWLDPPTSAFMLQHDWAAWRAGEDARAEYVWRSREAISPHAALAVIAAEDQRFPQHRGFDFDSIRDAITDYRTRGRVRGASTITQQVAKNLFLWPRQSLLRKGIEAWFTVLIELFWPKQRILEVYLNVAQFGPHTYGVEAASQRFFGKPAAQLNASEAALLAAVLPNPVRLRVDAPSPHVRERQRWIERQMRQLGGPRYLDRL
ncbi:MAG: monofunctional biosynthetic peptidoglycan transglycosylase [Ectothiorhodospiraceae bacterium]|nr:monofunctional biosynthetic peptidoglycan transglycosylase [Ectothiorhodospiraceae bacterium]